MNENSEAAVKTFLEGYNCAQAVASACGPGYGLPRDIALKVAQAFGGGVARTGNLCGAVSGALMVVGFKCAVRDGKDDQGKAEAYRLSREFLSRFKARHGALLCRELLGCDLGTEEGLRQARERGLHQNVCPKFVRDAVTIIDALLREPLEPPPAK